MTRLDPKKRQLPNLRFGVDDWDSRWEGVYLYGDGLGLVDKWYSTPSSSDAEISFVLAGWVEDYYDELLFIGNERWQLDILLTELKRRSVLITKQV